MQANNNACSMHTLINHYISPEIPNGSSNNVFENQTAVIQIYVKFTLCLQIQRKQILFHTSSYKNILKTWMSQLFPPVVSKLANLSSDNTHHSYFLLFSSCLRIFCVYYNQLGLVFRRFSYIQLCFKFCPTVNNCWERKSC